jgi:LysM repeat protein
MHHGRRRSAARLLAPLALLLAVAAVIVVTQASTGSDESNGDSGRRTATEPSPPQDTAERRPQRPSYTVKLNDTLVLISEKTGVPVERIEQLNPELDPQNLIVGQRIKLRE